MLLIDDQLLSVGTVNFEVWALVTDADLAAEMAATFEEYSENCQPMAENYFDTRT